MVMLSPKLNLRIMQKQILTPGLVQMVSVLALNKLELKDMINAEMVENPVLEELDGTVPLLDEVAGKEEERDRLAAAEADPAAVEDVNVFCRDRGHGLLESRREGDVFLFLVRECSGRVDEPVSEERVRRSSGAGPRVLRELRMPRRRAVERCRRTQDGCLNRPG